MAKSLVSPRSTELLYRQRRAKAVEGGVRTRLTFAVCLAMAVILLSFMVSLSVRTSTTRGYIESRPGIVTVPPEALTITYTTPVVNACSDASPMECYGRLDRAAEFHTLDPEKKVPLHAETYVPIAAGGTRQMLVRVTLRLKDLKLPAKQENLLLKLPRLFFERAHVYVDGLHQGAFLGSDPVVVPFAAQAYDGRDLVATALLDVTYGQDTRFVTRGEPVFVASHYEHGKYREFVEGQRSNPNSQIGILARVMMAIFALFLFLIIESSPEALGLALFMGFEACAMTAQYSDLRRHWIPEDINLNGLIHYGHAMGDVFRLYFYLQICRVTAPRPGAWLAWASVYSAIYGALRHFEVTFGWPEWAGHHITQRDLIVATIGMVLCTNTALHLRKKGLPWRVGALTLAALAATAQWLTAAPMYLPFLNILGEAFGGYGSLITIVNANCAYLFALSTFVNISTLENRVKVLSREKARAEAMEREMELGRSVQRAFLKMPSMPSEIGMSCHYEAAVYVSGDTYFVHWNNNARVLTFLLNDVTGHGIQAALKAFACNIIARSVWSKPWAPKGDGGAARRAQDPRLKRYDEAVVELICKDGDVPDFNAMVGVEFHLDDRIIRLYRVNYNFPILVEPNFPLADAKAVLPEQAWTARQLTIPNQEVIELPLKEGAFVLLISDGFMQSPRDQRHFVGYLNRSLAMIGARLNVNELRQTALHWEKSAQAAAVDDRTLLIFQWNPHAENSQGTVDSPTDLPRSA